MFDLQILLLIAEDNELFAKLSMVCKHFYNIMMEYKSKNFLEYENKYIQIIGKDTDIVVEYILDGVTHNSKHKAFYCKQLAIARRYKKGLLHRVGKPAVKNSWYNGYFINSELHRTDGPAYEDVENKIWCLYGMIYRIDCNKYHNKENFNIKLQFTTSVQRDIYVYNVLLEKHRCYPHIKTIYLHKNYNKYFSEK